MKKKPINNAIIATVVAIVIISMKGYGGQIFYESFEDPVISGLVTTPPTGWVSATGANAGLGDQTNTVKGATGEQYAWVGRYGGKLTTTTDILSSNLDAYVKYTFTCDASASRVDGSYPFVIVEILAVAGAETNVIAITTNVLTTANNLSAKTLSMSFVAFPDHPHIGKTLGIRLGCDYNAQHNQYFYFDDMSLDAEDTSGDTTPPAPTTMTWIGLPTSSVSNSITMQATNAVDVSLVQYFFTNTVNGSTSGWQDSPIWRDKGLTPGATYSYRVKARDKSANLNETDWSSEESATCEANIILYESFEEPSILPNTVLSFGTFPLPPIGWTYVKGNSLDVWHDNAGAVSTPFGEQYVAMREGNNSIMATLGGHVLQADYTYRATFNVGCMDGAAGSAKTSTNRVDLIAGTNVVASTLITTTTADFSQSGELEFIPDAAHANLGEPLTLKLWVVKTVNNWNDRGQFDNIKVYAIPPPPAGTFIILY